MVVISFLNMLTAKETKQRYIEEKFFERHGKVVDYRNRVVLGSLVDPNDFPEIMAKGLSFLGEAINFDGITDILE